MLYFVAPRKLKNQLKNKNNQLDAKPISTGKGKKSLKLENYIHRQISQPVMTYLFNQLKNRFLFIYFFRDNGITIQISMYQIYCELVLFLTVLIFIAIEKTLFWARIFSFISSTMIYVIHPIFYLFGDKNFRKRVLNQGIWKALKKELFQNNSEIQPVN